MKKAVALIICALLLAPLAGSVRAADEKTVVIVHTNDVHGAVVDSQNADGDLTHFNSARLKSFYGAQSADLKLLLDAGDVIQGYPFASIDSGESAAKLAASLGYDAIAAGNHEFDYGVDRLLELAEKYSLPFCAANVRVGGEQLFSSGVVTEQDGVKVGVFALTTPETAYKADPRLVGGVDFGTPESIVEDAKAQVEQLQSDGCDVIVALTHLGTDASPLINSADIAEKVAGIDLIIDGHSHSELHDYAVNGVPITSTGAYDTNVGRVTITVADGGVKKVNTELISAKEMAQYEPDAAVNALYDELYAAMEPVLSEVIGNSPVTLDGERSTLRYEACGLGRVASEALRRAMGADIAFVEGGSLRATLEAGDVTREDIVTIMPYGNNAVSARATGREIVDNFNRAFVAGQGSFPQYAGMTLHVNEITEKNDSGDEYTHYEITSAEVGGEPLDYDKEYVIAMSDYAFSGGDNYQFRADGLVAEGDVLADIFIDYINTADDLEAVADADNMIIDSGARGSVAVWVWIAAALLCAAVVFYLVRRKNKRKSAEK